MVQVTTIDSTGVTTKTVTEKLACIFPYWKSVSIPVPVKSKELVASAMPFLAATVHQLATRQLNS